MKIILPVLVLLFDFVQTKGIADQELAVASHKHIQIVHQDLSKWDKNGDGKLTGAERDAFIAAKRKEMADAQVAKQAGKVKPQSKPRLPRPVLNAEDARRPTPKGIPKNIEDAAK
jgi:hypothetical protein